MARTPLALLTLLLVASSAPAAVVSGSLLADFGSGNTTFDSNAKTLPDSPTAADSATVGALVASGGAAKANLPAGTLSVVGAAVASTNYPADTHTYFNDGNAILTYQENLLIQSSTLPVGTPVQVTIASQLAWTQSGHHTIPSNFDIHNNDASSQIVYTIAADSGIPGGFFSETDQSFYDPVAPATITQGIFTTPHLQQVISATVGSSISFYLQLKTYNHTNVAGIDDGHGGILNQNAFSLASAAIALGFSATDSTVTPAFSADDASPDITLFSPSLNQNMPLLANASPTIAQAALLPSPLPEPACIPLATLLAAAVSRRRRNPH